MDQADDCRCELAIGTHLASPFFLTGDCSHRDAPVEPAPVVGLSHRSLQDITAEGDGVARGDGKEDELDCRQGDKLECQ